MKSILQRIAAAMASGLPDVLMLAGASAVSYGAWLVHEPAGWVVAGFFTLGGGVVLARGSK